MDKYSAKKNQIQKILIYVCLVLTVLLLILPLATRTYVSKDGTYSSKTEVALYLYKYRELPSNYKRKAGENTSHQPADGSMFGGDIFRYEGAIVTITDIRDLRECDVDYSDSSELRGKNRLVYAADCSNVWYTADHYDSFSHLSEWSLNALSNSLWIVFGVFAALEACAAACLLAGTNRKRFLGNLTDALKTSWQAIVVFVSFLPVLISGLLYYGIKKIRKKE